MVCLYKSEDNPDVYLNLKEQKYTFHAIGYSTIARTLPIVNPLKFIDQDFVDKCKGFSTKATVVASQGDDKFKVMLAQEGNDVITYNQMMHA